MATKTQGGKSAAQRTRSAGTRSKASQSGKSARQSSGRSERAQAANVQLPLVTAQFHRPDLHLPGRDDVASAAMSVREYLPPREQMVYYGGLGLLAAFSVIEWPVAAAIGVGTAVTLRMTRERAATATRAA